LVIIVLVIVQFTDYLKGDNEDETDKIWNKKIYYTKHAKCRMDCRFIDKTEVEYIREFGKVNDYKSDFKDKPCPSIAKEGRTKDGQLVRIVFAKCKYQTKVITVIDLENNYKCNCK